MSTASFDALITQLSQQLRARLERIGLSTPGVTPSTSLLTRSVFNKPTHSPNPSIKVILISMYGQVLGISGYYELPLYRGRHDFVGAVAGGWTLAGVFTKHTGLPFTALIGACDPNHDRNGDGYCPRYANGLHRGEDRQSFKAGLAERCVSESRRQFPERRKTPSPPVPKARGCRWPQYF